MIMATGALRPCILPCASLRTLPRCFSEGRTAFWAQAPGKRLLAGPQWTQNPTSLSNRGDLVLPTRVAEFHGKLSKSAFCSKAVGSGSATAPTDFDIGSTPSVEKEGKADDPDSPSSWTIKMLYDGDCPLCMREVDMLRRRNETFKTIKFVDISSDSYSAEEHSGIDFEEAMGRIHAILRDGTVLTNVAAFKRLYEEVGLGWVYAITSFKPIGKLADSAYSFWAKYRLPLTGRPPLIEVLETRRQKQAESCDIGGCRVD